LTPPTVESTRTATLGVAKRANFFVFYEARLCSFAGVALSEEVDATVMGDPEQPRSQGARIVEFLDLPISLEQRFLNEVFPVEDGTAHASAIAMQIGAQIGHCFQKCAVVHVEQADGIGSGPHHQRSLLSRTVLEDDHSILEFMGADELKIEQRCPSHRGVDNAIQRHEAPNH
jgi:hypothetical protein